MGMLCLFGFQYTYQVLINSWSHYRMNLLPFDDPTVQVVGFSEIQVQFVLGLRFSPHYYVL